MNDKDRPFVATVANALANLPWTQNFRDKRAEELVEILTKFVAWIAPDATVVDIGAGYGEIAAELIRRTNCRAICIDSYTIASKKVAVSDAGKRISWISSDATGKLDSVKSSSADLVIGIYFLQVLGAKEKLLALEEMKRMAKSEIVIIDELPRGIWSFVDAAIHYVLNVFGKGKYEIYSQERWRDLFLEAGLVIKGSMKFGRNSKIYLLSVTKINKREQ